MESRRDFMKKGLYAAPVIMTVAVSPAFAGSPYQIGKNNGFGNGDQAAPGKSLPNNNAENGPRGNPN